MLIVGWVSSPAVVWRQGEDPERQIRFPVPAYLIETEDERILIDTGFTQRGCATRRASTGGACSGWSRSRTSPSRWTRAHSRGSCSPICTSTTPVAGAAALIDSDRHPATRVGSRPRQGRHSEELLPSTRLRGGRPGGRAHRRRPRPARRRVRSSCRSRPVTLLAISPCVSVRSSS